MEDIILYCKSLEQEGVINMKKLIGILSTVFLLTALSAGSVNAQGEATSGCLIIPPSARANAMGQSYVAIADDATSLWWNPAGMAFIGSSVDLMHSQLVPDLASDVFYEYIGGTYVLEGFAVIGASIQYLSYGKWEATDQVGQELGIASSYEVAPTIGGAIKITDAIALGMNLKFVYIDLAPDWATVEGEEGVGHSVAVDMGALWKIPDFTLMGYKVSNMNLGVCVSNIGPSVTYRNRDQAAPLPRNLRVGMAYTPISSEVSRFTVAADINRPMVEWERSNTYHVGGEFVYSDLIVGRAGYVHDKDGDIIAGTYGLGFIFNKRVKVDYANVPQASDLARVHRWSLGITF